jgi:catechol-2,3-dioxygenase
MLRDADAVATLAVKDLGAAARFYEETLGLSRAGSEDGEAVMFESGDTTINVNRSSFGRNGRRTDARATVLG